MTTLYEPSFKYEIDRLVAVTDITDNYKIFNNIDLDIFAFLLKSEYKKIKQKVALLVAMLIIWIYILFVSFKKAVFFSLLKSLFLLMITIKDYVEPFSDFLL